MTDTNPWDQMNAETEKAAREKAEKIARISRDPAPQYADEPVRDYPTTEKHYIICVDADKANESLPDASMKYDSPHKVGNYLVSDRLQVPDGWAKAWPRGTSIEVVKNDYPALYEVLKEKGVSSF